MVTSISTSSAPLSAAINGMEIQTVSRCGYTAAGWCGGLRGSDLCVIRGNRIRVVSNMWSHLILVVALFCIPSIIYPVVSDVDIAFCEDLLASCRLYDGPSAHAFKRFSFTETVSWPLSPEYLASQRQAAQFFCGGLLESGMCFRSVNLFCSDIFDHQKMKKASQGWFHAEFLIAFSKLCQLPNGSFPFARAMSDCTGQHSQLSPKLVYDWFNSYFAQRILHSDLNHFEDISPDVVAAHRNLCQFLEMVVADIQGSVKTELVEMCGGEFVVNVLVEDMKNIHLVHCINMDPSTAESKFPFRR
ncbi:uncharacterized protein LOC129595847 [Paramacrobiotus metropolitanus]|uniref:uncharacterized protein LOC129595847 n=1 Tax=Paramacrobiotus metropolitanus TaxID=2943436 RepID=UPI00244619C4|nr:uncharacterized protein LOC129595847 [Paramacrobiotus metropolitanus]